MAWDLKDLGVGVLSKTSGTNWHGWSIDVIMVAPGGATYDILRDAEGDADPIWSRTSPSGFGDLDDWQAPLIPPASSLYDPRQAARRPVVWPAFSRRGAARHQAGDASVTVVEHDGALIACWPAVTTVHADGAWIAPGYRKNPVVFRTLTEGFFAMLRTRGLPQVLTVPQTPEVVRIITRWGAVPLGTVYLLPVPEE